MDIPNFDNVKKWAEWFGGLPAVLRYGLSVIVGITFGVCVYPFISTQRLLSPFAQQTASEIISARPDIATFGNEWPRTNCGTELNIFSDVKFLNRSQVSYETIKHPHADDYFLRMYFALEQSTRSLIRDAYCGVYFEWTDPPPKPIDASSFAGLRFRASYSLNPLSAKPRFVISVATLGTCNFAFHEYDFSKHLPTPNEFHNVEVPFNLLSLPNWATNSDAKQVFDSSKIFRISIVVKGTNESGYLDLDDLICVSGARK